MVNTISVKKRLNKPGGRLFSHLPEFSAGFGTLLSWKPEDGG